MKATAALTVCLLWLLLLLVFSTPAISPSTFLVSNAELAENSWTFIARMPTARSGLGVAVVNGKIYAIGGTNGKPLGVNEEYDPSTNTWTTKKPMPTPRYGFGIAVFQNKIYVIGGDTASSEYPLLVFNKPRFTNVVEVYDPETDTWETKRPMPTARGFLCANVVNGKIYLIGGTQDYSHPLNINEVYDPLTDTWTTGKPVPYGVHSYASAVVDNKIYIIGGQNGQGISTLNQIYDPETDTWSRGASLPIGVKYAAAGATTGVRAPKRIYVIGGYSPEARKLNIPDSTANQVYDPKTDTWTKGKSMNPSPRYGLGVAVINDVLYAIGGQESIEIVGYDIKWWVTEANQQYTPFGYGTVPPPDTTPTTEPFPTLTVAAIVVIAIVGTALLVYSRKIKKRLGKPNNNSFSSATITCKRILPNLLITIFNILTMWT